PSSTREWPGASTWRSSRHSCALRRTSLPFLRSRPPDPRDNPTHPSRARNDQLSSNYCISETRAETIIALG
ncbi:hypothetical protein PENTCL1PPCAC_14896, partial [Pristionchus entomophagus]